MIRILREDRVIRLQSADDEKTLYGYGIGGTENDQEIQRWLLYPEYFRRAPGKAIEIWAADDAWGEISRVEDFARLAEQVWEETPADQPLPTYVKVNCQVSKRQIGSPEHLSPGDVAGTEEGWPAYPHPLPGKESILQTDTGTSHLANPLGTVAFAHIFTRRASAFDYTECWLLSKTYTPPSPAREEAAATLSGPGTTPESFVDMLSGRWLGEACPITIVRASCREYRSYVDGIWD
jgi:hypothetical protein